MHTGTHTCTNTHTHALWTQGEGVDFKSDGERRNMVRDEGVQAARSQHSDWLRDYLHTQAVFGLDEAAARMKERWGGLYKLDSKYRATDARIEKQFPNGKPQPARRM